MTTLLFLMLLLLLLFKFGQDPSLGIVKNLTKIKFITEEFEQTHLLLQYFQQLSV